MSNSLESTLVLLQNLRAVEAEIERRGLELPKDVRRRDSFVLRLDDMRQPTAEDLLELSLAVQLLAPSGTLNVSCWDGASPRLRVWEQVCARKAADP